MRKTIYIIIGILGLLLLGFVYFLYTRDIEYVFNDKYYERFLSYITQTQENTFEGFFHVVEVVEEDQDALLIAILDTSEKGNIQILDDEHYVEINIKEEHQQEVRPTPCYFRIQYEKPKVSFLSKIMCNFKSLPEKCYFPMEIESVLFQSFLFQNIQEEERILLLSNFKNMIGYNREKIGLFRYSQNSDYELVEYLYNYFTQSEKDMIGAEVISIFEEHSAQQLKYSYPFIPIIEDEDVKNTIVNHLCENLPNQINQDDYYDLLAGILGNRYCMSDFDEENIQSLIESYQIEDYDTNINSQGIYLKELALCIIATTGDIQQSCKNTLSYLVNQKQFWYNYKGICERSSLDIFCSKEFLYTFYILFLGYE